MLKIEHKYLVCHDDHLREASHHRHIRQGYLAVDERVTARVRTIDEEARLTIKGSSTVDRLARFGWEYSIPIADAEEMLSQRASHCLEKMHYYVPYEGFAQEVGRFGGRLEDLVMAEVELTSLTDRPALPSRLKREVTGNVRYYNAILAQEPAPPPTI